MTAGSLSPGCHNAYLVVMKAGSLSPYCLLSTIACMLLPFVPPHLPCVYVNQCSSVGP